jgi:hypothetical protein
LEVKTIAIQYVWFFSTWTDLMFVQGEGGPDMPATPDSEDFFCPAAATGSTSATPLTSSADSSKIKYEASSASKTPSRSGTPKSRSMLKRTLQDTFAEGSAKENQILERLGTQKHERAIGELELKRRKMEHKAMEKQHQREREREEHEFRMLRMRLMITQNQQTAPGMQVPGMQVPGMQVPGMQAPPQSSLNGFGLMSELTLPESSSSLSTPYSI